MKYKLTVIGHVGSVNLYQADGKPTVLNIDLATNLRVGDQESTVWTHAKVWYERALKLAPHVKKGALLLIEGRPEVKGFARKDGSIGADLVLHASEVVFLSAKNATKEGDEPAEN